MKNVYIDKLAVIVTEYNKNITEYNIIVQSK